MTTFSSKRFKSAQNILISRLNIEPESFTTSHLKHNYALEYNMVAIGARVTNLDSLNTCIVRLHSPHGAARLIPASTAITITEWFEEIYVEPNAGTGTGTLQVELVETKDALRPDAS